MNKKLTFKVTLIKPREETLPYPYKIKWTIVDNNPVFDKDGNYIPIGEVKEEERG